MIYYYHKKTCDKKINGYRRTLSQKKQGKQLAKKLEMLNTILYLLNMETSWRDLPNSSNP